MTTRNASARIRNADGTFAPKTAKPSVAMTAAAASSASRTEARASAEAPRSRKEFAAAYLAATPAVRAEIALSVAARAKIARTNATGWARLATAMAEGDIAKITLACMDAEGRRAHYAAVKEAAEPDAVDAAVAADVERKLATPAFASKRAKPEPTVALVKAHTLRKPAKAQAPVDAEAALVAKITAAVLAALKAGA